MGANPSSPDERSFFAEGPGFLRSNGKVAPAGVRSKPNGAGCVEAEQQKQRGIERTKGRKEASKTQRGGAGRKTARTEKSNRGPGRVTTELLLPALETATQKRNRRHKSEISDTGGKLRFTPVGVLALI